MKRLKYLNISILISFLFISEIAWALPSNTSVVNTQKPIIIIVVDKLDSMELFASNLPGIKRFLASSACGLMNIRSSKGYTDSASGYLSLGAGSRANAAGAIRLRQSLISSNQAGSYIDWNTGIPLTTRYDNGLVVPELGWILNQARLEDHPVIPGRLGTVFQNEGWRTCLIGNIDSPEQKNRPGGLFLMNRHGLIDEGNIDELLNKTDPDFPYLYRANVPKIITELRVHLAEKKIIAVDFGDFARLDTYREQMNPDRYIQVKQHTWERLNLLLEQILQLGTTKQLTSVLISPSISKEGTITKNLLAPVIINSPDYPPGLLVSGTTRWPGLIANIDLLPTLANIAHLKGSNSFAGKTMTCIPQSNSLMKLRKLNEHLVVNNANQRPILNWYQGIISFCWIAGWLGIVYLNKRKISDWVITVVAVIPLSLIILPLLPDFTWQVTGFISLTLILTAVFARLKNIDTRFLILSGAIWLILIIDQVLGWSLIRFSALGYNAMAGSRYYGLGNEFLGVFLAAALLFTHLLYQKTAYMYKWPAPIILSLTIFILSWPQFGAKFGGILAGTAGFAFYLMKLYHWKLNNSKLWLVLLGCGLVLFSIGWWDSMRPSSVQTHIGRFLHLLISKDFGQVGQIMIRKLGMNLKLTVFSPWSRIILLALTIGIVNRLLTVKNLIRPEDSPVWQAIMVSGITAYLVNDAGVLAFATCLAYAFSFMLLKSEATITHSH